MSEIPRLHQQLSRAWRGEAWHGPSLGELLDDTSAAVAAARPIAGAHTIWEIAAHIDAWVDIVRRRILGDPCVDVTGADDWPPVADTSDEAWAHLKVALADHQHALLDTVASLPDSALERDVKGHEYTHYVLLHGAAQHMLYHAGQIALLKKA